MTPRKLKVLFTFFSYGGNGGIQSEVPHIREWFSRVLVKAKSDHRVETVEIKTIADTPITMSRNLAVEIARKNGADVLAMIDSDMWPDYELSQGDPLAKPFWDTSFDFLYQHYERGPVVIGAPYGGPPNAGENVYVFQWTSMANRGEESPYSLEQYTRAEAAKMGGIQPCAALPTGVILYDMRCFDLLSPPYFYYEWTDQTQSAKASTEDVTNTRSICMNGQLILGYNPVHCNWDAWAGHWKPWCVSKPKLISTDEVNTTFKNAVLRQQNKGEQLIEFTAGDRLLRKIEAQQGNRNGNRNGRTVSRSKPKAEIVHRHWLAHPRVMAFVESRVPEGGLILEVGPGTKPFSKATCFVGRKAHGVDYGDRPFHELDLNCDDLPFLDGEVDFLYCRHVLEDLESPAHFLREVERVAQAGYIETPSPLAECCHGVDEPTSKAPGRGYAHHRSLAWDDHGLLTVLPKYPSLTIPEQEEEDAICLLNTNPFYWNTYFLWKGQLSYLVLQHEQHFQIGVDQRYDSLVLDALHESMSTSERFESLIEPLDPVTMNEEGNE